MGVGSGVGLLWVGVWVRLDIMLRSRVWREVRRAMSWMWGSGGRETSMGMAGVGVDSGSKIWVRTVVSLFVSWGLVIADVVVVVVVVGGGGGSCVLGICRGHGSR